MKEDYTANDNDGKYVIYIPDEDEDEDTVNENYYNNFSEKEQIASDNKSIEFVKQRIASGQANGMENNKYSSISEMSFPNTFRSIINYWNDETNEIKYKMDNVKIDNIEGEGNFCIEIKYDENTEFEYFSMERCICDGTLFYIDLANSILQKLIHIGTYNINTLPSDFNKNPFKYNIRYTVGNFIIAAEYGEEFATKEKPWMKERQTVMLPIKCEWINKENLNED